MPDKYIPPFTMTEEIVNKVIEIGELVGQIVAHDNLSTNPKLWRENRIKTILFIIGNRTEYIDAQSSGRCS